MVAALFNPRFLVDELFESQFIPTRFGESIVFLCCWAFTFSPQRNGEMTIRPNRCNQRESRRVTTGQSADFARGCGANLSTRLGVTQETFAA